MFQECFLEYYKSQYKNIQNYFFMSATYCDPDGIHDMRVEIKRLRAFFKLIEWIAPAFQAKKNIRNIRKLFKAAAEIRDIHVQQELTREWTKKFHLDLSEYYNALKQKEIPARKHFSVRAEKFDIEAEFEKNEKKMVRALKTLSDEYASEKTRVRVDQLIHKMIEFGSENRLQGDHLHKVRILAKEARYTIEIACQCFPELGYTDEVIKQLRGLHQVLGKWHDDDIALKHIAAFQAEIVSQIPVKNYDKLSEHLQKEKTELLATFEKQWDDFEAFLNESPFNHELPSTGRSVPH